MLHSRHNSVHDVVPASSFDPERSRRPYFQGLSRPARTLEFGFGFYIERIEFSVYSDYVVVKFPIDEGVLVSELAI